MGGDFIRRRGFRVLAGLVVLLASGSIALAADKLPISGTYGNEEGCRMHRNGTAESDALLLLQPDWVQSYGTGCEILQVLAAKNGDFLISGICGFEGEGGLGAQMMVIAKVPEDPTALRIYDSAGTLWGDVKPCE